MNFVIRFTTLLAMLALGACGGDSKEAAPPVDGGNNPAPPPVVSAPTITAQPVNATANEGGAVTFTVVASGEGLSYQWHRNGAAIAGATTASYTTPALTAGDNQATYAVTVANAGGSVTSSQATLTVAATPPPPGSGGDDDGPLQPLVGPAEPFPQVPAPMRATPTISGVSPNNQYLLGWDPASSGMYSFGFLHPNGAETRTYLPVGAFLDDIWLTTADVRDIGPAVTSVVAALDIEPGDLITEKTMTVNFMIPDSLMATIDPAQLIGFAADSDGSNLHLVPIVIGNLGASITRPSIRMDRLGIVGIAVATPEQQDALASAVPTDPADQLIALLAPGLTERWRDTVTVSAPASKGSWTRSRVFAAVANDDSRDRAIAVLRGYYNDVVVPAFTAADGDPSLIPAAISAALSFQRMTALSGESGPDGAFHVVAQQLDARMHALMDRYADHVAAQCRSIGGPAQMQLMLGTLRQLALLGHEAKSNELSEILPQCSEFKVEFRAEYTRAAQWFQQSQLGDVVGQEEYQVDGHAVVEGTHVFGPNTTTQDGQLRLTTLDWTQTRHRVNGDVIRSNWVSEGITTPWRIVNLSTPVVRTRGGTPPTTMTLYLSAFTDFGVNSDLAWHPFTVTVTHRTTSANGTPVADTVSPFTRVELPMFVPALPGDGQHNYGAMLIPRSGSATSQATRTIPYHGGSIVETETVTVTLSRPE